MGPAVAENAVLRIIKNIPAHKHYSYTPVHLEKKSLGEKKITRNERNKKIRGEKNPEKKLTNLSHNKENPENKMICVRLCNTVTAVTSIFQVYTNHK